MRNSIQIPPISVPHGLPPTVEPAGIHIIAGTRVSTVLLVRRDGQVLFVERDVWKLDDKGKTSRGDPRDARVFRFIVDGFKNKADGLQSKT